MKLFKISLFCLVSVIFSVLLCTHLIGRKKEFIMIRSINSVNDAKKLFPQTVDEITSLAATAIQEAKQGISKIIAIPSQERTFDNTWGAYDRTDTRFSQAYQIVQLYELVQPYDLLRNAAQEQSLLLQRAYVDLFSQNKELYDALHDYAVHNAQQEQLTPSEKYFIEETLKEYKRNGITLPDEQREKIKVLIKDISELTTAFDKNIATDNRKIYVTRQELEGLDDNFINSLQKNDEGLYALGVDYPAVDKIMGFCANRETRKKLSDAFSNRAYPQNEEILKKMIEKRDELAKALGYQSYAHLSIESEMAKTPEHVESFLNDLLSKIQAKATAEVRQLTQQLPPSVQLSPEGKIYPWDKAYLLESYKKKHFNINENEISEYFPMENTIKELLSIYEQFLSLELKEESVSGMWHPDVKLIAVHQNNQLIGYLFLDLYPRENKYTHACHTNLVPAMRSIDGTIMPAVSAVIANFPKSTATQPSLLKRYDVTTFFHEFGHALHGLLGATRLGSQSGTRVKKDFVEMPSQMLEEWLSDPQILKKVSKHYQTGEPLSDEMIKKILKLKNLSIGNDVQRQISLAFLALDYFKDGAQKDPYTIFKNIYNKIRIHDVFYDNNHFYTAFGHLTVYGSQYYSYLWSKVFALDLFDRIKAEGLLNPAIGTRYEEAILMPGGSKDPNELLYDFLGRAPTADAFMHDLGL